MLKNRELKSRIYFDGLRPKSLHFGLAFLILILGVGFVIPSAHGSPLPDEPIEIGLDPQFFIDDYLVDNRWGLKFAAQTVQRAFHQPKRESHNPVLDIDSSGHGWVSVVRDQQANVFRMWYQVSQPSDTPLKTTRAILYAESKDGLKWDLPKINKFEWKGTKENNAVFRGLSAKFVSALCILDLPPEKQQGYRFVMCYGVNDVPGRMGLHLIGSQNGTDWNMSSDRHIIHAKSDTMNTICWDLRSKEYVCFMRAVNLYHDFTDRRRVARLASKDLWSEWVLKPQNILIPDEKDAAHYRHDFYGMPTHYHAGIYWGFLLPYRLGREVITELAVSRDGKQFERFLQRTPLIDLGPKDAWDGGQVYPAPRWVEVGDEWWIYYIGSKSGHNDVKNQKYGIGLTRVRKEGFVSLRSPRDGGCVVTRTMRWPGGELLVNADAGPGELKVRVTDERRKPFKGFDFTDSKAVKGDGVAHRIGWTDHRLDELKGMVVRLEFLFSGTGDLYTFRADTVPRK